MSKERKASTERKVQAKRIYEPYSREDGYRVLVDRLWPRGLTKAKAHISTWAKDVAPSTELRQWYAHDPKKWEGFKRRYKAELRSGEKREALRQLRKIIKDRGAATLVFAARDTKHSNAAVLLPILRR